MLSSRIAFSVTKKSGVHSYDLKRLPQSSLGPRNVNAPPTILKISDTASEPSKRIISSVSKEKTDRLVRIDRGFTKSAIDSVPQRDIIPADVVTTVITVAAITPGLPPKTHEYKIEAVLDMPPDWAEHTINDLMSLFRLLSQFPTGFSAVPQQVWDHIEELGKTPFSGVLEAYQYVESKETIEKLNEYNAIVSQMKSLPTTMIGTFGVDFIEFTYHGMEILADGTICQKGQARTLWLHVLKGYLRWEIYWNPKSPRTIQVKWHGWGNDNSDVIGYVNGKFAISEFPGVAQRWGKYIEWEHAEKNKEENSFEAWLMAKYPDLAARAILSKLRWLQKSGAMYSMLLEKFYGTPPDGPDPPKDGGHVSRAMVRASAGADALAIAVYTMDYESFSDIWATPGKMFEILSSNGYVPEIKTFPDVSPGIYYDGELVDFEEYPTVPGTPEYIWQSSDESAVFNALKDATIATWTVADACAIQQAAWQRSTDLQSKLGNAKELAYPFQASTNVARELLHFDLTDPDLVGQSIEDHGGLDAAFEMLVEKEHQTVGLALESPTIVALIAKEKPDLDVFKLSLRRVLNHAVTMQAIAGSQAFLPATVAAIAEDLQFQLRNLQWLDVDIVQAQTDLRNVQFELDKLERILEPEEYQLSADVGKTELLRQLYKDKMESIGRFLKIKRARKADKGDLTQAEVDAAAAFVAALPTAFPVAAVAHSTLMRGVPILHAETLKPLNDSSTASPVGAVPANTTTPAEPSTSSPVSHDTSTPAIAPADTFTTTGLKSMPDAPAAALTAPIPPSAAPTAASATTPAPLDATAIATTATAGVPVSPADSASTTRGADSSALPSPKAPGTLPRPTAGTAAVLPAPATRSNDTPKSPTRAPFRV